MEARQGGAAQMAKRKTKRSPLEIQLENLSEDSKSDKSVPVNSKIITLEDFKQQH